MILEGKKVLVTGVLNDASIAFSVARVAQEQGAEILLSSHGRVLSLAKRAARRLPDPPDVLEFDGAEPSTVASLSEELGRRWGRVDGVVHAIGFAPQACLGGDIMQAGWEDVSVALQVSAYSLKALAEACLPHMKEHGGSIVGLDFDARQAWPQYDWMGVAKAALESTSRYLARDLGALGVRCNLVAAGPLRTVAARNIGDEFSKIEQVWVERAPLGWDVRNPEPAARAAVALLSDWFPATTGEIVHVDGGFHAIGA